MNINELFKKIQTEFGEDDLKGEVILQGNVIIWSYNLNDEIDDLCSDEDDEELFNYEASCDEERLIEAYHEDLEDIQLLIDRLNETENWNYSDYEIVDDVILFKLF